MANQKWVTVFESAVQCLERVSAGQIANVASIGTTVAGQTFIVETER
jgi:hypothetical protein